ncbi:MAG: 1-acyl-sn-glycerol-3-phosphate acyltransferase [Pseudomonadales bacterium]|jgi:1-acyl-sn-glycerol-3-phosphate acyltransferase|nr:1-acyl-sn-glycerol-3-phosphate acyltransferase [Pseudomonadales bacterium]
MQWLASLVFTSYLFVWTPLYGLFYVAASPFLSFHGRYKLARFWARSILKGLKVICRLDYRLEGIENIPAEPGVFYMKHSSAWETIAQMALFPPLVWVMKREVLRIPIVGWGCTLAGCIAIDRKSGTTAVTQILAQGKERFERGAWVMVFPEGTRLPPGETRKYGVSGALLAQACQKLIVPIAHDAGYFWGRRAFAKKPGTITVRVGPPIQTAGREPRDINAQAQAWIEANVVSAQQSR